MPRRSAERELFLRRLREARRRAGLSQVQAARRLGKTQGWLSKCEAGEIRIEALQLKAFARLYNVRLDFFFEG